MPDTETCTAFIHSALDDADLSVYAFRLYCRITRRAGHVGGTCTESMTNMAKGCSTTRKRLKDARDELENRGLIRVTLRDGQPPMIQTTPRSEWVHTVPTPGEITPGENREGRNHPGRNHPGTRGEITLGGGAKSPGVPGAKSPHEGNPSKGNPLKVIPEGERSAHADHGSENQGSEEKERTSGDTSHEAIQVFAEVFGRPPRLYHREQIIRAVDEEAEYSGQDEALSLWRETLEAWHHRGWSVTKVSSMLDRYQTTATYGYDSAHPDAEQSRGDGHHGDGARYPEPEGGYARPGIPTFADY